MSEPMKHYVCDRCGNLWSAYRPPLDEKCYQCGHGSLWEFDDERKAAQHSADIKGLSRA